MKHFAMIFLGFCALVGGCRSEPEKRYAIEAEVITADAPRRMITVKHGDIPGLMPAMTMSYAVDDPKSIETLQPGDKISAELVVSDEKGHLEKIKLISRGEGKHSPGATLHLPTRDEWGPAIERGNASDTNELADAMGALPERAG